MNHLQPSTGTDRADNAPALQQALVDKLKSDGHIRSAAVEAAFRVVPRHLFVPGIPLDDVYRDQSIPTKRVDGLAVSSSSQPAIMAIMLEQLGLEPGHRVLEIGAGTGYNAALMAHLVGSGEVVTLDIDEDIVEAAQSHLAAAGFARARAVCGDGAFGFGKAAPFDRIVLTVGAADISPAWPEQLKPDGRLLLPLRIGGILTQKCVLFERSGDDLASVSVNDANFMMLRGAHALSQDVIRLGTEPDLRLWADELGPVDPDRVYRLMAGPSRDWSTGLDVAPRAIWGGLIFWLGLHEPTLCGLAATGAVADRGEVPWLVRYRSIANACSTVGLLGDEGLCLLTRPPGPAQGAQAADDEQPFELCVRGFGSADQLVGRLISHAVAWDAAGRLSGDGLRIKAYPLAATCAPLRSELAVEKRSTRLVLSWA